MNALFLSIVTSFVNGLSIPLSNSHDECRQPRCLFHLGFLWVEVGSVSPEIEF